MTGKIVSEVARLWLCTTTHSREDKHKDRHSFKKRASQYKRRQQRCTTAKRWDVDKENYGQDHNVRKKSDDGKKQYNQENSEE